MNSISKVQPLSSTSRAYALLIFFALVALALGAFVVLGTFQALAIGALALLATVTAFTIPLYALTLVLAALVSFQFYFFIPGTNFAFPASLAFVAAAALRVALTRGMRDQVWLAPAAVFVLTAFIATISAANQFEALKGIYAWAPIFACAFIAARTVDSPRTRDQATLILVALGVIQAILGLIESAAGLDRVLGWLAAPLSEFIFPPNLLHERLSDLSFNWNLGGRVLPFGTFINNIDYAIFLTAVTMLALARAGATARRAQTLGWLIAACVLGSAVFLTLKGSGWLAFAAGAMTLAIYFARRLSRRQWFMALALGVIAVALMLPFAETLGERAAFLIERESSDARDLGRLRIWSSLLPAFAERPLFGYGLNNSPALGDVLRTLKFGVFGTYPVSPESAYVQTLIETGAIGFIALMSWFALTFARALKNIRANNNATGMIGILAALVALWAGNLTVSAFTTDQNGMLMGLLIGLVFASDLTQVRSQ